jgi:hypothetical protein
MDKATANHYHLIRTNPHYRAELRLQELEDKQEPCHFREYPAENPEIPEVNTPRQEDSTPLYNRINQLQAELNFTRNKLNEHLDKNSLPKSKTIGVVPL